MSHRNWKFRLQDISDAIQKIDRYVEGMRFEEFLKDEKTADAVIRQLTIIGEAASHIPEEISSLAPDIPWRSIRGIRNIVVHEYFGVNMQILWKTVVKNIPDLNGKLKKLDTLLDQQA